MAKAPPCAFNKTAIWIVVLLGLIMFNLWVFRKQIEGLEITSSDDPLEATLEAYPYENHQGLLIFTQKGDCATCTKLNPIFIEMHSAAAKGTIKIIDTGKQSEETARAMTVYKVNHKIIPIIIMCYRKNKQKVLYTGAMERQRLLGLVTQIENLNSDAAKEDSKTALAPTIAASPAVSPSMASSTVSPTAQATKAPTAQATNTPTAQAAKISSLFSN